MRTKLVVGNWKMHGSRAANQTFLDQFLAGVDALQGVEVALCVPFPYLAQMQSALSNSSVSWGAQNVCEHSEGAYTGEVGASMLADFSCKYVLVGHSERRVLFGESSALVAEKYARVLAARMIPILCVGETLAERESGQTLAVIDEQLSAVTRLLGVGAFAGAVVAYEPVWAIGTGRTASVAQVQEVHQAIRNRFSASSTSPRVLYGGSVKVQSAGELFALPDVDGGLVGGASLVAEEFLGVCRGAVEALRAG